MLLPQLKCAEFGDSEFRNGSLAKSNGNDFLKNYRQMTENGKNAFGAISVDFGIFGNLRTRVRLGLTLRLG